MDRNKILNILTIYSYAEKWFNEKKKSKLFINIKNIIYDEDRSIKYKIDETRNPKYTREVNECRYIFLASFCLCLTEEEIQLSEKLELESNIISIKQYLEVLQKINLSMQDLNTDLNISINISLNDVYIIDELIVIIELQKLKKKKIQKIWGSV